MWNDPADNTADADDLEMWARLRSERNHDLAATDWTQLPDAGVDAAAWATYRQALRDLPAGLKDPRKAKWPARPDAPTTSSKAAR